MTKPRVLRGGSYPWEEFLLRGSVRHWLIPDERDNGSGFRCVLSCPCRVVRGSSWYLNPHYARASYRYGYGRVSRRYYLGFRCVAFAAAENF